MAKRTITVIHVSATADYLRGFISRYLTHVGENIYVGSLTTRVRSSMWRKMELAVATDGGRALLIHPGGSEAGWTLLTCGEGPHSAIDADGLTLVIRTPDAGEIETLETPQRDEKSPGHEG